MPLEIKLLKASDLDAVQLLYNHKDIIGWLGGFTLREQIASKISEQTTKSKPRRGMMWGAWLEGKLVGFSTIEGRKQAQEMKNGAIGVLPEYRRRRIGTALLFVQMVQAFFEGRRYMEDTIVGDNPYNSEVLPTLGYEIEGTLRKKTASLKDIVLYGYHVEEDSFQTPMKRVPDAFSFEVFENQYTADLWNKNMDILQKHKPDMIEAFAGLRTSLKAYPGLTLASNEGDFVQKSGGQKTLEVEA